MPRVKRSVWFKVAHKLAPLPKRVYWAVRGAHQGPKRIVFVCGAAKSGKTLLCSVLDRDRRVTVFREDSAISGRDGHRLRLKPIPEITEVFERCPTPVIVAEAKVDSQHAASLLRAFPGSKVLWVWRNFEGAVAADLQRFSSQRETLLAVVRGDTGDWRSESVSETTREIVCARYSDDLPRADVAALFWYVRNTLWFDQGLDRSAAAALVQYEEFCRSPESVLRRIYERIDVPSPVLRASRVVRPSFLDVDVPALRPETRALCSDLAGRLAGCTGASPAGAFP